MKKRQVHAAHADPTGTVHSASGISITFNGPIAGLRAI
jgi:hypothetical protein